MIDLNECSHNKSTTLNSHITINNYAVTYTLHKTVTTFNTPLLLITFKNYS